MKITTISAVVQNDAIRDKLMLFAVDQTGDLWVKEHGVTEWERVEGPSRSTPKTAGQLRKELGS